MAKNLTKAPGALAKIIASKIRAARIEAGMSQEELGKHLGVTFQQVQKYEKGVNRITPDRLQLIAEKFGRPINYFFEAGSAPTAPDDTETIGKLLGWIGSSGSARRVLTALPSLNEADAEVVAAVAQLLASRRTRS
jgi:transcriptional regulator with XRE-family HTH domain